MVEGGLNGASRTVIIAAIIVALVLIATITGCVMFWWRRLHRRKTRVVAYQRLSRGGCSEWSTYMRRESNDIESPGYSLLDHEKANSYYSEASYDMAKQHYSWLSCETHYAEPRYETANTEPSYYSERRD